MTPLDKSEFSLSHRHVTGLQVISIRQEVKTCLQNSAYWDCWTCQFSVKLLSACPAAAAPRPPARPATLPRAGGAPLPRPPRLRLVRLSRLQRPLRRVRRLAGKVTIAL